MVPGRETFQPSGFSALIFSVDGIFKFVNKFIDETVFFGYPIKCCDNTTSFLRSSGSNKVTPFANKYASKDLGLRNEKCMARTEIREGRIFRRVG